MDDQLDELYSFFPIAGLSFTFYHVLLLWEIKYVCYIHVVWSPFKLCLICVMPCGCMYGAMVPRPFWAAGVCFFQPTVGRSPDLQWGRSFRISARATSQVRTFHPSGVGKWVPAAAEKAKAVTAHFDCGWTCGCAGNCETPWEHVTYLSASAVVIHYQEALYQVYASLPYLPLHGINI